jgi:hypothetical protein
MQTQAKSPRWTPARWAAVVEAAYLLEVRSK